MPKKKEQDTKQAKNPKKVDNKEKQENKPEAIKWEELDKYIGQPVWDSREKEWRVLVGYKRHKNTFSITFTDVLDWQSFCDRFLYLEEVENEK